MFGKSKSGGTFLGGSEESSSGNSMMSNIPGFQEEPACAKMCPKLTYQQRYAQNISRKFKHDYNQVLILNS